MMLDPGNAEELAAALGECGRNGRSVELGGAFSKRRMGGAHPGAEVTVSTSRLNRVLEYQPKDLTISVEAGMKWAQLQALLATDGQMIALDPPYFEQATVGGVLASNTCGPRRRLYGSPRDVVIGMRFVTIEGKLVPAGGMVVKNVAGLDMGKLMIGSFGTLAAMAVANFKLTPAPPASATFLFSFAHAREALALRDRILAGVLQPAALDLLNPHASARVDREGWLVAVQAGGIEKVIGRYRRELEGGQVLEGEPERAFWTAVREFGPHFLAEHEEGAVVRVSAKLQDVGEVAGAMPVPVVARAGNGVVYGHFPDCETAVSWLKEAAERGWRGVAESVPPLSCTGEEQWPAPGDDLNTMKRIKEMMDPQHLLNRGRLYGRL